MGWIDLKYVSIRMQVIDGIIILNWYLQGYFFLNILEIYIFLYLFKLFEIMFNDKGMDIFINVFNIFVFVDKKLEVF